MSEIGRKASNAVVAVVDFYASERAQLDAENERLKVEVVRQQANDEIQREAIRGLNGKLDAEKERANKAERSIFELTEKLRVASDELLTATEGTLLLRALLLDQAQISKDAPLDLRWLVEQARSCVTVLDRQLRERVRQLDKIEAKKYAPKAPKKAKG